MSLPRMRGLVKAINEFKQSDPDSCLTLHALRQMLASGTVPSVRCGRKILIDIDKLGSHLSGSSQTQPDINGEGRHINPVSDKRS